MKNAFLALGFLLLCSCGVGQILNSGRAKLASEDYAGALKSFETALKKSPDNTKAKEGLRDAQRGLVSIELQNAENDLRSFKYASALASAVKARRMPLDLDAVDLITRIDRVVFQAADGAESLATQLKEKGHFYRAVRLSERIVTADPGSPNRRKWADELRQEAQNHYLSAAERSEQQKLFGATAVQRSLAKAVGADVSVTQVESMWKRFSEPTCFAEPKVSLLSKTKDERLLPRIRIQAEEALSVLRKRCGVGTTPLSIVIDLSSFEVVDKDEQVEFAKPYPGVKIETEEVYLEEIPYEATEEVVSYETRTELVEKRDCAPRPGKARGCRSWTESVEKKVPVTTVQKVIKTKSVERRRPRGDLPDDKVLKYQVNQVLRRVEAKGVTRVKGADNEAVSQDFWVRVEDRDDAHPEVIGGVGPKKMVIPEDALEAKSLAEIIAEAGAEISESLRIAVDGAALHWSEGYYEEAREYELQGRLPEAEEQYLRMLALGVQVDLVERFAKSYYGEEAERVMLALAVGLGRAANMKDAKNKAKRNGDAASLLPTERQADDEQAVQTPLMPDKISAGDEGNSEEMEEGEPMELDEEMKALEEDAIDAADSSSPSRAPVKQSSSDESKVDEKEEGETP